MLKICCWSKRKRLILKLSLGLFFACQRYEEEPLLRPHLPKPAITYLFWTDLEASRIMRATLHDTSLLTIDTLFTKLDDVKSPHGLAVDAARQQIYWAEYTANQIKRANWAGQGTPEIVYAAPDSVYAPVDLALNSRQNQLYWTEPTRNRIQAAPLHNKGNPRVLYNTRHGLDGPFGLALTTNYVYWAEPMDNQIMRASVTGAGRPTILYHGGYGIIEPFGLALDTATSQLYILDNPLPYLTDPARQDQIFRGNTNGSNALTSLFNGSSVQNAYSLAIDRRHGKLYWLNQLDPSLIMQGNLDGSGVPRELIRLNSIGFALAVAYSN